MTEILKVNPDVRSELAEALSHLCDYAKRQPCVVETFAADPPTRWSRAHERINAVLDDYERAARTPSITP